MSLQHSPQIVTSGLVFYYDMYNTKKSWKGANTVNLITNGDFSNGLTGYGGYETTPTIVTSTSVPSTLGISRNVLQSTPKTTPGGGGTYGGFYMSAPAFTVGQPYTISFYARSLNGSMFFGFSNQNGAGDNSNFSSSWILNGQWQYCTKTTASLDLLKTQMYFYNANLANSSFQIADLQIENSSFASPFTSSARSSSNNSLDLLNTSTITNTNVTYNSDGSISYVGSSNNESIINYTTPLPKFTIEVWAYPTSAAGGSGCVISDSYPGTTSLVNYCILANGQWRGGLYQAGWYYSNPVTQTLNVWQHVVYSFDGVNQTIYLNGVSYGNTTTYSGSPGCSTYGIKLGRRWDLADFYNGKIGSAKIYNRALTAEEVLQNFNAHRGRYGL